MIKLDFYRSLTNVVGKSGTRLLIATLVWLITFNLGWLLMFVKIFSRLTKIKYIGTTILNLELFLVMGNVVIIICSIGFTSAIKFFKAIGKKILIYPPDGEKFSDVFSVSAQLSND